MFYFLSKGTETFCLNDFNDAFINTTEVPHSVLNVVTIPPRNVTVEP